MVYLNAGTHGARESLWLRLRFGAISHARLLGMRVEVFRPGTDVRLGTLGVYAEQAYKSGTPLEAHFGLGKTKVMDVVVHLPGGRKVRFEEVEGDRFLELDLAQVAAHEVPTR